MSVAGRMALVLAAASLLSGGATLAAEEEGPLFTDKATWLSIDFPGRPVISKGSYEAVTPAGGTVRVPATLYTVTQPGTEYRVTVANLAGSAAEESHALESAAAAYRKRDGLALDTAVSHSLGTSGYQLCGRSFGYQAADGRLVYETLFYNHNTRLFYDVRSSVAQRAQAQHGSQVSHFQQSLAILADPASKPPAPLAYPEGWKLYDYADARFSIRFPAAPTVEEGDYRTDSGIVVPATRYWARSGGTLYRLTVAKLWETEADDGNAVDDGARLWTRNGTVVANDSVAINAAQCGRDIALKTPDGLAARARIFFPSSQHRLYVIEVAQGQGGAAPGAEDVDRFLQSFAVAKPE
jgi:hypothetical protein